MQIAVKIPSRTRNKDQTAERKQENVYSFRDLMPLVRLLRFYRHPSKSCFRSFLAFSAYERTSSLVTSAALSLCVHYSLCHFLFGSFIFLFFFIFSFFFFCCRQGKMRNAPGKFVIIAKERTRVSLCAWNATRGGISTRRALVKFHARKFRSSCVQVKLKSHRVSMSKRLPVCR